MNFKTYAILGVVKSMSMKKNGVNTQLVFTLIQKKKKKFHVTIISKASFLMYINVVIKMCSLT